MFIIPVGKQVNWRRPPPATLLLILLNVLAFIFIQGDDDRVLDKALAYYQSSALPQLELPYYVAYLKEEKNEKIPEEAIFHLDKPELQSMLALRMQWDEAFMARLRGGKIIPPNDPAYAKWRTQRARFDELIGELSVERFGFKPAAHKPLTLASHMFMHGDLGHLFGNMLFLFLVGFMTERVLGARPFLLAYFIAGLGAVELFGAVYPASSAPLVGASGAIAGLMGLYTLIFGLRKVEFFYSIFFYFDYVRAPAILLLPIWIGNEFYQLFTERYSNVAYVAHIGGLISGALIGAGYRKWMPSRIEASHAEVDRHESFEQEFARGQALLGELKIEQARMIFEKLSQENPDKHELLKQLYQTSKFHPDHPAYHAAAARLMQRAGDDPASVAEAHEIYLEYAKLAKPGPRFTPDLLLKLAARFAATDYLQDAEKLAHYLLKKQPANNALPGVVLAVAKAYYRAGKTEKYHDYLKLIARLFPGTKEARVAADLLAS